MKYMKLGSKPDVFQTEGNNIRLVGLRLPWHLSSFRLQLNVGMEISRSISLDRK